MKTVYVTGATGCVGRNLVNELLKDGWRVIALHRKSSDLSRLRGCAVETREIDLLDPASVARALRTDADTIFHVAANLSHWSVDAEQQWRDNVLGTRNLVETVLKKPGMRFVLTSTGAVLPYQHLDEAGINRIRNGYTRTKRLSELEVEKGIARGLDAVILRLQIVFGAHDYNSYAQIFEVMRTSRLRPCFSGRINFCHAGDVARGHIQAFERGRRGEYYVLSGPYASWRDAFREICKCLGVGNPVAIPYWLLGPASRVAELWGRLTGRRSTFTPDLVELLRDYPDINSYEQRKTETELGYRSRPLDVMIRDCYEWLVEQGRLPARTGATRQPRSAQPMLSGRPRTDHTAHSKPSATSLTVFVNGKAGESREVARAGEAVRA